MAEAALAAIGAAASVVQLGDAALRLSRSICNFIGELKDAKDHMRHLRSTLDDTSSLMRNLIAYIREFQDAPSTKKEHEVLPEVVTGAVQHFHDGVESVRECLPPNLSPNFAQKFRFVFDKKKIRNATSKLEGCKASTSLALNIVCSRNNIKLRNDLSSLRIYSETAASEQKIASRNSSQQTSQLLAKIQDMSKQQSQAFPSLEQVDKRTLDITAQLQSIHTMVAAQSTRPRRGRSTKTFDAVDEDTLAKLVRVCVMQTLEMVTPEMNRDETSKVDDLSTNVASKAHHEGFFDAKEAESSHTPPEHSIQNRDQARRSNTVRLFQKYDTIRLRWAIINLRITGLRLRQTETQDSASCFSIEIDFTPRRFVPFGISLSYTNAPNCAGYYSICPTILTFNVISDNISIERIFEDDDADTLQHLIMNRKVGVRDRTRDGSSLLQLALIWGSAKCLQYLVSGTGIPISTGLSFSNLLSTTPECYLLGACDKVFSIFRNHEYLVRAILDSGFLTESNLVRIDICIWSVILFQTAMEAMNPTSPNFENKMQLIRTYKELGYNTRLFSWMQNPIFYHYYYPGFINSHESYLKLYLEAGEDPNEPLEACRGFCPLECAVSLLAEQPIYKNPIPCYVRWSIETASPQLLVLLIKAGADIFYINEHSRSITDLALELGVEHLWTAALIECGYDPSEVKTESERRKLVYRRLHSAERSGVDTEVMEKVLPASGLRHRSAAKTAPDESVY